MKGEMYVCVKRDTVCNIIKFNVLVYGPQSLGYNLRPDIYWAIAGNIAAATVFVLSAMRYFRSIFFLTPQLA